MATPRAGGWRPWEIAQLTISEYRDVAAFMRTLGADDGVS